MNVNELISRLQIYLNTIANALALYPSDSLLIKSIPIVISVFNELIAFTDAGEVEERLKSLEDRLGDYEIEIKYFQQKISTFNNHNLHVLRKNVKYLCLDAYPETKDLVIEAIIQFVMNENTTYEEEICEIITELNSNDIEVLKIYKLALNNNVIQVRGKKRANENKTESDSFQLKDRNLYYPDITLFWCDFIDYFFNKEKVEINKVNCKIPFNHCLTHQVEKNKEEIDYSINFLAKSILKLRNLGIIDTDSIVTLGNFSENNIDRMHLTIFGERILSHL